MSKSKPLIALVSFIARPPRAWPLDASAPCAAPAESALSLPRVNIGCYRIPKAYSHQQGFVKVRLVPVRLEPSPDATPTPATSFSLVSSCSLVRTC